MNTGNKAKTKTIFRCSLCGRSTKNETFFTEVCKGRICGRCLEIIAELPSIKRKAVHQRVMNGLEDGMFLYMVITMLKEMMEIKPLPRVEIFSEMLNILHARCEDLAYEDKNYYRLFERLNNPDATEDSELYEDLPDTPA